jgi:RNA polymerase sigma-70 factor, ECF subfamily
MTAPAMVAPPPVAPAQVATVRDRAMPTLRAVSATTPAFPDALDPDSRAWLRRLRADGPEREQALAELRDLLLGAARFEVGRRRARMPQLRGDDHDDLAQQSANDALVAILAKLDDFRGESRFTTWAYKFALYEAAASLRRRSWQGREVPLEAEHWPLIADTRSTPDEDAETSELLRAVGEAIESELTDHQREILVAVTLNGVPIDVLAERLTTTRGALYKTLHDARRRLRASLSSRGLRIDPLPESEDS